MNWSTKQDELIHKTIWSHSQIHENTHIQYEVTHKYNIRWATNTISRDQLTFLLESMRQMSIKVTCSDILGTPSWVVCSWSIAALTSSPKAKMVFMLVKGKILGLLLFCDCWPVLPLLKLKARMTIHQSFSIVNLSNLIANIFLACLNSSHQIDQPFWIKPKLRPKIFIPKLVEIVPDTNCLFPDKI